GTRDLSCFPTRRSSDLDEAAGEGGAAVVGALGLLKNLKRGLLEDDGRGDAGGVAARRVVLDSTHGLTALHARRRLGLCVLDPDVDGVEEVGGADGGAAFAVDQLHAARLDLAGERP